MSEEKKIEHTPLSASRIKQFQTCSWSYARNYIDRIPQLGNSGSAKGSIAHEVFELLLDSKYKVEYDKIVAQNTIKASDVIYKLVFESVDKNPILINKEKELKHIEEMILVGLNHDFFVEGGKLISAEYKFDIENEDKSVRLRGFLDKASIKDDKMIVYDYKSSKKKFSGEDLSSSIQGLAYSFVAKRLWPHLRPVIRFVFLQFPKDPIQELEFNEATLKGFEEFLRYIQVKIDNFTEKDAKENFAADKKPSGEGFDGSLNCGFSKYPGQMKKDGSGPIFSCQYKWELDYFVSLKDGIITNSSFKEEELVLKDGETIEKRRYFGCPRFNNTIKNFNTPISPDFGNVLNDF